MIKKIVAMTTLCAPSMMFATSTFKVTTPVDQIGSNFPTMSQKVVWKESKKRNRPSCNNAGQPAQLSLSELEIQNQKAKTEKWKMENRPNR